MMFLNPQIEIKIRNQNSIEFNEFAIRFMWVLKVTGIITQSKYFA